MCVNPRDELLAFVCTRVSVFVWMIFVYIFMLDKDTRSTRIWWLWGANNDSASGAIADEIITKRNRECSRESIIYKISAAPDFSWVRVTWENAWRNTSLAYLLTQKVNCVTCVVFSFSPANNATPLHLCRTIAARLWFALPLFWVTKLKYVFVGWHTMQSVLRELFRVDRSIIAIKRCCAEREKAFCVARSSLRRR